MEGFELFTLWSHPGSQDHPLNRQLDPGNHPPRSAVTWRFSQLFAPWSHQNSGVFLFPAQITVPTSPWPWHEYHTSPTTTKDIYPRTQWHLPAQPKAFASTTQGICLQNSRTQRHFSANIRCDIEGFQLITLWSHPGSCPTRPQLNRQLDPGNHPPRSAVTWRFPQLFTPWSHQN